MARAKAAEKDEKTWVDKILEDAQAPESSPGEPPVVVHGEIVEDQVQEEDKLEQPAPQLGLVLVPPAEKFKAPNTLVMEMAARALDRNFKYFAVVHGEKLDAIQKLQDKIDELNNESRRREKILKIAEKITVLQEELEAFEAMFSFTKSAKKEVEPYVQLEFDFGMDKAS